VEYATTPTHLAPDVGASLAALDEIMRQLDALEQRLGS